MEEVKIYKDAWDKFLEAYVDLLKENEELKKLIKEKKEKD